MRRFGSAIPPEFEGKIDAAILKRTCDYEIEKSRFRMLSSAFSSVISIMFIFGGILNIYNSWIVSLDLPFIVSGWLFFILLAFAGEIISIPFSLYSTFRIENKYGFNTMTMGLWGSDLIKALVISTILMSLVFMPAFWIIQKYPDYWWLLIWMFLLTVSVFLMYISPYVIEPLFNKFTPVEDESLKDKITALTNLAGIHAGRILKIDASKRSRHTNAYFTGIGRVKRIVLYDTLIEGMNHDEILAVLAHEIGHWKKRHLFKTLAGFEVFSLISLYVSYRLIQDDFLLILFNISSNTVFAKFMVLAFIGGILSVILQPAANFFSRRHERQADRASYELTNDAESMVSALVKLSKENLSNLYPHPLYVALYYSHPPILERISYIKRMREISKVV